MLKQVKNAFPPMKISMAFANCVLVAGVILAVGCNRKNYGLHNTPADPPASEHKDRLERVSLMEQREKVKGSDAYERGLKLVLASEENGNEADMESGRKLLENAAKDGYTAATYLLSCTYLKQRSPSADETDIGIKWLKKAACDGFPAAQSYLGELYRVGLYVERDDAVAAHWFRKAAKAGDPVGMGRLYLLLAAGIGESINPSESALWCRKVIELEANREDQYAMGLMLESGFGVERDMPEAVKYYKLAAAQGHEMAKEKVNMATASQHRSDASDMQKYVRNRLEF